VEQLHEIPKQSDVVIEEKKGRQESIHETDDNEDILPPYEQVIEVRLVPGETSFSEDSSETDRFIEQIESLPVPNYPLPENRNDERRTEGRARPAYSQ
jgi:hypothetical protein